MMLSRTLCSSALFLLSCGGLIDENEFRRLDDMGNGGESIAIPRGRIPPPALGSGGTSTGGSPAIVRAAGGSQIRDSASGGSASGGSASGGVGTGGEEAALNIDCTGPFFESTVLFRDPGWVPQALAPTRDGLELYYARLAYDLSLDDSRKRHIMVRRRASLKDDYGEPLELPELDNLCDAFVPGTAPTSVDISGDALRLYIGCNVLDGAPYPPGPLILATRPDRDTPFTVNPEPLGLVGISLGLSKTELEAFGSSADPSIHEVLYYTRDSVDDPFGSESIVPGAVEMKNAEPAPDGITLMGVSTFNGSADYQIVVSTREKLGAPFSTPSAEGMPIPPPGYNDHSPALGADCRTLYYLRYTAFPEYDAAIMVAKR